MNNYIVILTISFLAISCGKDPSKSTASSSTSKLVSVIEEAQPHLDRMNEFMTVYLKEPKINNLIVEFTDDYTKPLEAVVRGYCDKSGSTPKVYLYRPDWIGPYANTSYFHKEAAFFHLVGHCVFNKPHDDRTFDNSSSFNTYITPYSLMHSNFQPNQISGGYGGNKSNEYVAQFFGYQGAL